MGVPMGRPVSWHVFAFSKERFLHSLLLALGVLILIPYEARSQSFPDAEIVPLNKPELCGTYSSGHISMTDYFPGGEGGAIALYNPRRVASCCTAFVFEGVLIEEGVNEPVGNLVITYAHWAYDDVFFVEMNGKTYEYEVCE